MKKRLIAVLVFCFWIQAVPAALSGADQPNGIETSTPLIMGEKLIIRSQVLKEERILLVHLPRGYRESKRKFPVLYLLDGEFFFQQATAAVRFLSECGYLGALWNRNYLAPQLIVVGIVNVDRNHDYTPTHRETIGSSRFPTSGGAAKFLKFFETELIPFIDSRYRTHPYRVISGWSLGGLFTLHAFLNKPDLFDAYIAVSPSMWWDNQLPVNQAEALIKKGKINTKPLVVTLGSQEKGSSMERPITGRLVPLLKNGPQKIPNFHFLEIEGENHFHTPYKGFYEGLRALYSRWVLPGNISNQGPSAITSFYQDLSRIYGYPVEMPEVAYSLIASAFYRQGKIEEAMATAARCKKRYPESSFPYYLEGRLYQRQNKLELARKYFQKALDVEKANDIPDSEVIGIYEIRMREITRK
jgi:predicted alpha/beta superfamily hydrolase